MSTSGDIETQQMDTYDMWGLFLMLGVGLGMAVVSLITEFVVAAYLDTVSDRRNKVRGCIIRYLLMSQTTMKVEFGID